MALTSRVVTAAAVETVEVAVGVRVVLAEVVVVVAKAPPTTMRTVPGRVKAVLVEAETVTAAECRETPVRQLVGQRRVLAASA